LGFFWISSHAGIARISKAELNRCADGQTTKLNLLTYEVSDGLPSAECSGESQPAGCKTADGRFWFPTAKGLVGIDPAEVRTNQLPPPVVIEKILLDGLRIVGPELANHLQIAPGRHRLEIEYAGLSFVAPEQVRFKYRLEGLEHDWVDAEATRRANYSYIPPGDYVFRVTACNNDRVWSDSGASLAFTVQAFFWQTLWFRTVAEVIGAAAIGCGVLVATRRRMRRKLELLERQQAIERERARIAKDIHDDLGASLTRITLLSQSVHTELNSSQKAAEDVHRIYTTARELTHAMDEIVWAVNPQHDSLDSLASYLGKFAQDYLRPAGVRCRLDLPMQLPHWPLSAETRHNLFLSFKEALHNIVKHSGASEVSVKLTLKANSFALTVQDNGRGFSPEEVAVQTEPTADRIESGNGMPNMRHRLTSIGGNCAVQAKPGLGTTVMFEVPLKLF
jgi:signal transduction histidine kinase